MGDLITDAIPMGSTPAEEELHPPPQQPREQPKPGRQVYNITGSQGVHIGSVINHVSITPKRKTKPKDMPLRKDVEALQRCHREIEDRDKYIASEHLGKCWKSLGRAMGFSSGQLENIEADYSRSADRVNELLSSWHDRESEKATVAKLTQLVIEVKAYHVLKYLKP